MARKSSSTCWTSVFTTEKLNQDKYEIKTRQESGSDDSQTIRITLPDLLDAIQVKFDCDETTSATYHVQNTHRFRVVSYNLLADVYASTAIARTHIFRQCPIECLNIRYRLPLILRELLLYKADILCLQEVDVWVFEHYLKPLLTRLSDMDGMYLGKRLMVKEPGPPPRIVADLTKEKDRQRGEKGALTFLSLLSLVRHATDVIVFKTFRRMGFQGCLVLTGSEALEAAEHVLIRIRAI
ncbi:unnamed protein product [Echinostoma caproni]|uniref:Endo/exonuclease/phosphatase domain-containing protein n=1 Tax=Echinostoma caproni TaxID=27848 RepID=A0A183ANQ9_9TREM|nr:unnamed protein product [Echinostoma caproni]